MNLHYVTIFTMLRFVCCPFAFLWDSILQHRKSAIEQIAISLYIVSNP